MSPNINKLLTQIRSEVKDIPPDHRNIVAVERTLKSCLADLRSIKSSDEVFISRESLEALYNGLSSYPDAMREGNWHEVMSILRENLGTEG